MNIVVTGATSFLGAALCKELVSRGHQVYAVVRPGSNNRQVLEKLENAKTRIAEQRGSHPSAVRKQAVEL